MAYHFCDRTEVDLPPVDPLTQQTEWSYGETQRWEQFNTNIPAIAEEMNISIEQVCHYINMAHQGGPGDA